MAQWSSPVLSPEWSTHVPVLTLASHGGQVCKLHSKLDSTALHWDLILELSFPNSVLEYSCHHPWAPPPKLHQNSSPGLEFTWGTLAPIRNFMFKVSSTLYHSSLILCTTAFPSTPPSAPNHWPKMHLQGHHGISTQDTEPNIHFENFHLVQISGVFMAASDPPLCLHLSTSWVCNPCSSKTQSKTRLKNFPVQPSSKRWL